MTEEEKKESKEIVKQKEKIFQTALQEYRLSGSKKSWDAIFLSVFDACKNIAKSNAYGLVINDLEEKALNATCKVCQKIKDGENPKKLSSYCYLFTIGELWNKETIRWERSGDFSLFENYAYYSDKDGQICLCKEDY
jgi:hypothetical protein